MNKKQKKIRKAKMRYERERGREKVKRKLIKIIEANELKSVRTVHGSMDGYPMFTVCRDCYLSLPMDCNLKCYDSEVNTYELTIKIYEERYGKGELMELLL